MIVSSSTANSSVVHFSLFHLRLNIKYACLQLSLPFPTPALKTEYHNAYSYYAVELLSCLLILCYFYNADGY